MAKTIKEYTPYVKSMARLIKINRFVLADVPKKYKKDVENYLKLL